MNMVAINFDQASKGQVSSPETALSVVNTGNGEGVRGTTSSNSASAVTAISNGGGPAAALTAISNGAPAGWFQSAMGVGVRGTSYSNDPNQHAVMGVGEGNARGGWFQSKTGEGVRGTSYSNDPNQHAVMGVGEGNASGGWFQSKTGEGVRGTTYSNDHAAVVGVSNGAAPAGFFAGNVQVSGDLQLLNADCAEDFDIVESETVETGTVMVLSEVGSLRSSYQEYDKKVAGIVSGARGYKPAIVLDRQPSQNSKQ